MPGLAAGAAADGIAATRLIAGGVLVVLWSLHPVATKTNATPTPTTRNSEETFMLPPRIITADTPKMPMPREPSPQAAAEHPVQQLVCIGRKIAALCNKTVIGLVGGDPR